MPSEFTDADVAALYDELSPWDPARWPADGFYDDLVAGAGSVLDVGCGTGAMLHKARSCGHQGRLAGIDPDRHALARARRYPGIEWVEGTAAEVAEHWQAEFELATMVSHAFQCLIEDADVLASLAAIRTALRPGGRFAFETRHPQARAWADWHPGHAEDVRTGEGRALRVWHEIESVVGDVVTMTETTAEPAGEIIRVDRGTLRFLDVPTLARFLAETGFTVDAQYGDWQRGPITRDSREIVTIARRS
jgi:SAM-dependent methyltransferase